MSRSPLKQNFSPVKIILVTGSVVSGVGKGIIASSLGVLLKANGYRVSAIKIDPYINVDAGTFNPFEHGEVFVLDDGGEVDLDLGNYERFLNVRLTRDNSITTGKIYQQVIDKERQGVYLGKTVQTIPHITGIVALIPVDGSNVPPHVCIVELGGIVGDIESMPYIAAFTENYRKCDYRHRLLVVHVTMLLDMKSSGEKKTKPAQNGIRKLRESGLVPDLVMFRSDKPLSDTLREKITGFAQLEPDQIIDVYNVSNIYKVPLLLLQQDVLEYIQQHFELAKVNPKSTLNQSPNMVQWSLLSQYCEKYEQEVRIALVAKYIRVESDIFTDAYASVVKALHHSAMFANRRMRIEFINSENLESAAKDSNYEEYQQSWELLKQCDGILVPGGFGDRGIEGKVAACRYARENKVPFLGICLGLQCAVIEFARNVLGVEGANSTEFTNSAVNGAGGLSEDKQVVIDMPEHTGKAMGATMRLGKQSTVFLTDDSILRKLYGDKAQVEERHRHRYEVNPAFVPELHRRGFRFVGMGLNNGPDYEQSVEALRLVNGGKNSANGASSVTGLDLQGKIDILCARGSGMNGCQPQQQRDEVQPIVRMEIAELPLDSHPYFVGVQYHPEFLSHPLQPSPPIYGLVLAASGQLDGYLSGGKIPSPMEFLTESTVQSGKPFSKTSLNHLEVRN